MIYIFAPFMCLFCSAAVYVIVNSSSTHANHYSNIIIMIIMQVDVYKDPVDDHSKVSKKGRLTLDLDGNGQYVTKTEGAGDPTKVFHIQCHSQTLTPIKHLEQAKVEAAPTNIICVCTN